MFWINSFSSSNKTQHTTKYVSIHVFIVIWIYLLNLCEQTSFLSIADGWFFTDQSLPQIHAHASLTHSLSASASTAADDGFCDWFWFDC